MAMSSVPAVELPACRSRLRGPPVTVRSATLSACLAALVFVLLAAPSWAAPRGSVWSALKSGHAVALTRHATAPGTKDPANFNINSCATQRNLSAGGRAQARRTGQKFKRRGIRSARVYTSAWCRCRDTARLLGLGGVSTSSALNSLPKGAAGGGRTGQLSAVISSLLSGGPAVLVTHKTNIRALTGITPASGETIVVGRGKGGRLKVLGRIPPG